MDKHKAHVQAASAQAQLRSGCKPAAVGMVTEEDNGVIRKALPPLLPLGCHNLVSRLVIPCFSPKEPNQMSQAQLLIKSDQIRVPVGPQLPV